MTELLTMELLEPSYLFCRLAAAWNCTESTIENVEITDCPFSPDAIVKTHEEVKDFPFVFLPALTAQGVTLYVAENCQVRKGFRRGDMFIGDFGKFRLFAFTGEGVIKD